MIWCILMHLMHFLLMHWCILDLVYKYKGRGELHENIFSILLWDTSNLVILAWKLGCFIVRQPNKYSCFGGPCHPEDLAWMFGVAGQCWMEGAGRGCFPLQYKQVYTCHKWIKCESRDGTTCFPCAICRVSSRGWTCQTRLYKIPTRKRRKKNVY